MSFKGIATLNLKNDLPAIYSDFSVLDIQDEFVVISKAAGVDVHRDGDNPGIAEKVEQALNTGKLYLVHRLDKVTSGLMLLARSAESCDALARLFREKQIQKYYLALSDSKPGKKQGRIVGDMARSRRGSWKLLKSRENPAITQFFSASVIPGIRAFLLKPHTGKTHQLRVAMKSLGAPVAGDHLYAGTDKASQLDRVYLHAFCISFVLCNQNYRYSVLPDQGALFCSDEFRTAILPWQSPERLDWPGK
ncbi:TIGR01621 family pseudouridine synthase [Oceanospirillum sp. D5]|uniref:TIGR01621 family pseudouridine synthase n=1 Tax=Oceanospirillum sediminis TaxID=2760088 RepID=A0A839IT92_9GAMM|nr:TIGR01621 family pseudouridine synthase [Oceanospirillum sediminis]